MALLTGKTAAGVEVPVQVDQSGRLVAEGLQGPQGPQGPKGDQGLQGPKGDQGQQGPAGTAPVSLPGLSHVAWVYAGGNQPNIDRSFGVSSIDHDFTGVYRVNFANSVITAQKIVTSITVLGSTLVLGSISSVGSDSVVIEFRDPSTKARTDPDAFSFISWF